MNELHRQAYLSALGIENYMPRVRLPMAPDSVLCNWPSSHVDRKSLLASVEIFTELDTLGAAANKIVQTDPAAKGGLVSIASMLDKLTEPKSSLAQQELPAAITIEPKAGLLIEKAATIVTTLAPFSLSIWRPRSELMIIDSRQAQLALPTERLLQNILTRLYEPISIKGSEEILRWPLIENTSLSSSHEDVRNTLQVWLDVELERRPITQLWLFGETAVKYFSNSEQNYVDIVWHRIPIAASATAIVFPSLVELLQQPLQKRHLWQTLTNVMVT